jgi:N-methylhydantoinase B
MNGELQPLSDNNRLRKGDLLRIMTPGGGGWGDPLDRDAAQVRDDLLDGFVSAASALEDYGVVFAPATLEVDESATRQQRLRMRRQTAMFHRKEYLTALD